MCVCVLVFVTVAGLMFFFAGVQITYLDSLPPSCVEQTKRRKKL